MSKEKGIKLSPKHGVNPSIQICFWCNKEIGLALLGKLPNDEEAPRKIVADYDPCDECKDKWDLGITIIEVTKTQPTPTTPAFQPELWATGRYVVVNAETPEDKGQVFIELDEDFEKLLAMPMIGEQDE